MYQYIRLMFCLTAIIVHNAAYATKLSHKEYERFSGAALQIESNELLRVRDAGGNYYIKAVRGLLSSNKGNIAQYITEIPCNIINTLESDVDEAKLFVDQIEEGQVPSIITNLPQEAVDVFGDVLNILTRLPSEVIQVGEAAVTDVVNIVDDIEDGSITSVLAALPSEIIASVTNEWDDFTDGLTDAWNGLTNGLKCDFGGPCPTTPVETCGTPALTAAASTTPANAPSTSTNNAGAAFPSSAYIPTGSFNQSTTQPSLASRSVEWAVGHLLGIAALGILGIAVLL